MKQPLPIEMDRITYEKLKSLARLEGRTVDQAIEAIILQEIARIEQEHGEIVLTGEKM